MSRKRKINNITNIQEYVVEKVIEDLRASDEEFQQLEKFFIAHSCIDCGELANYPPCKRCGTRQCYSHLSILVSGGSICNVCIHQIGGFKMILK